MADLDYANARLRAMKSRLLARQALEELSGAGSVSALIAALTNTAYREAVQAALARTTEVPAGARCLTESLRTDLIATLGRAPKFFSQDESVYRLAAILLRRFDLHNVKTILRGLARHAPADEILANTLPIGELRLPDLTDLARATDVSEAVDRLVTWRVLLARPLIDLRARRSGHPVEVAEMEIALERWHLHEGVEAASSLGDEGEKVVDALRLRADVMNILTALRLIGGQALPEQFGVMLLDEGRLPLTILIQVAAQEAVEDAIALLTPTRYGAILNEALTHYALAPRLSHFERALERYELEYHARWFARDSLGIGIMMGYIALKMNEIANLRAIAQGLVIGESAERIRSHLLFAESI